MTHAAHIEHARSGRARRYSPVLPIDSLLTRGVAGGLLAGQLFIVANMYYALNTGSPPTAPFLAISTIFRFSEMPMMNPVEMIVGLNTHLTLSMLFGVAFAFLAPLLRTSWMLVAGSLAYGLALYVVNFQVIARFFFPFLLEGPNQVFEAIIHPLVYGLVLAPFFLSVVRDRSGAETTG